MGAAIRALRIAAGLSQEEAAARAGMTRQAWQNYEAGVRHTILRQDTQERIAAALGASHQDLVAEYHRQLGEVGPARGPSGSAPAFQLDELTIRDTVQAGAWLAADDTGQDEPRTWPAPRDPRYPLAEQWLSEVVGDSMNALGIFAGDLMHCVSAIDVGYFPRTGDIVEVERLRFGGAEREMTLKQVEVTPGAVLLWPRSTNPRWREPLEILEGTAEGEEIEVRIRGLAVGAIRRF